MSLAGRLDSFPLPEVLGLLARSSKSGCLHIRADGTEGDIYLLDGALTYGSTQGMDNFGDRAVAAGLVEESSWLEVERREKNISDVLADSKGEAELAAFVRELVTDAMFRLGRDEEGEFDFEDDLAPPYETGQRIEIGEVLTEVDARVQQWHEVEAVIPGVNFGLRMAPFTKEERDVVITGQAWRVLSALDGIGSIAEVADRLGSNDFQVGRVLAELVQEGLVVIVDDDRTNSSFYYYGDEGEDEGEELPEEATPDEAAAPPEEIEAGEEKAQPALFRGRKGLGSRPGD